MRPHGLFSWTDISLPDPADGKRFYTELFGWTADDQHDPDGNYIYTMFFKDGLPAAGMGPQQPGHEESGIPPMWNCYISVDEVDATLARIEAAGGSTIVPAMDVMTAGRMAFAADPSGGVFALWQAGEHLGAGIFNQPGAMTWNELATRDVDEAREFYAAAFGWDFEEMPGPMQYWVIKITGDKGEGCAEDDMNGGILAMDENWPPEMPPHWMVYFAVDDTDEAVKQLTELGGSVSVPPFDTPAGRIAVVGDSQGGTFSMITVTPAAAAE